MPGCAPATPESCHLQGLGPSPRKRSLLVPPKELHDRMTGIVKQGRRANPASCKRAPSLRREGSTLEVEHPSGSPLSHLGIHVGCTPI